MHIRRIKIRCTDVVTQVWDFCELLTAYFQRVVLRVLELGYALMIDVEADN